MSEAQEKSWKTVLLSVRREFSPPHDPGEIYSRVFEDYCDLMVKKKIIESWKPTVRNSKEDAAGIDYWIKRGSYEYPFQVTSNYKYAGKHIEKHPGISVIYMIDKKTGEIREGREIFLQLIKGIGYYNQARPDLRRQAEEEPKTIA